MSAREREPKERGSFFRNIVSSIGSSGGAHRATQTSTSTSGSSTGGSPVADGRPLSKTHSFSGNLPFSRTPEDGGEFVCVVVSCPVS